MATRIFKDVSIRGVASAVPSNIHSNQDINGSMEEIAKIASTVGIEQRHTATNSICTSDLCYAAANKLLSELNWDRDSVDALIFLSQTPDYTLPATSCILQNRLGLATSCAAFDMSLGCSGYVYGLMTAFGLISGEGIKRVLLLVGDTISKVISPEDVPANILFGDAGTATAIEFDKSAKPSYFTLGTDGSGANSLIIEAGGFRKPSSDLTKISKNHPKDQVMRSEEDLFMDGTAVFSFTLSTIPKAIEELLSLANLPKENVDSWLFHQANKFMLDYFGQKVGIDADKVPMNIGKYGNTSPPSLPLLITTEGGETGFANENKTVAMLGFGVGFSWGGALLELDNIIIPKVIYVNEEEV